MTLGPLLHSPFAVQLHVATVIPAFLIGTYLIFFSKKGAPHHRALGYVYLTLMTITAIAAIFVHIPDSGLPTMFGFSPIHLFVPLTLLGVVGALRNAWAHNIPAHRGNMLGVYIGGIMIAGTLAFMPGRLMHVVVFGS